MSNLVELKHSCYIQAYVTYSLYIPLTFLNIYYFKSRILKLQSKQFHLIMFVLLQLSFTMLITSMVINQQFYSQALLKSQGASDISKETLFALWRAGEVLFALFYAIDMVGHCVFAMRYWVLSLKIQHMIQQTVDKNFKFKTSAMFYFMMLWIVCQSTLEMWFWWNIRPNA